MKVKVVLVVMCYAIYAVAADRYYTIDGMQYYISYPYELSWIRALRHCTYYGMFLVDIQNSLENDRIINIMDMVDLYYNVSYRDYWTSGTDQGKEGDYYWASTGHPIMYDNWKTNEPSASPNEHCIHYVDIDRKWNDAPCDIKKSFVCRDSNDIPKTIEWTNFGSM